MCEWRVGMGLSLTELETQKLPFLDAGTQDHITYDIITVFVTEHVPEDNCLTDCGFGHLALWSRFESEKHGHQNPSSPLTTWKVI